MHSPLGLSIITFRKGSFFTHQSFDGSQIWVSSSTRGRRFDLEDGLLTSPHSMCNATKGWGHLRVNPGFGVFWFIPLLLDVAYLQPTSFIGRIFSCLSKVGMALFQTRQPALGCPLGGVRV